MILSRPVRSAIALSAVAAAAALAPGCASPYDGVRRGPWMHHSINEAYRLAEADGAQPVKMATGIAWVERAELTAAAIAEYRPTMTTPELVEREQRLKELAASVGVTCRQIVRQYNEAGKNWAIFGESITWTSVAAGLTALGDWLAQQGDGDGDGDKKTDGSAGSAGPDREVEIDQSGRGNLAEVSVVQDVGAGPRPNVAIRQDGDGNVARIRFEPPE